LLLWKGKGFLRYRNPSHTGQFDNPGLRGGFYIGPLVSIVGGFLVYKNEKIVNSKKEEIMEEEILK
jgi:hypothetical protein